MTVFHKVDSLNFLEKPSGKRDLQFFFPLYTLEVALKKLRKTKELKTDILLFLKLCYSYYC